MRVILVRHYKTTGNLSQEIVGWTESPPAEGWQVDMQRVLQYLAEAQLTFHKVYTSDLKRAYETGAFYAQSLGIHGQAQAADLREINYGVVSKKSKAWVEKNLSKHKKDPDFVYPDGESFAQMQQRSVAFVDQLALRYPQKTLLVVAHAGVIRGLVSHFLQLDYAANLRRKITHCYIGDFHFDGRDCIKYDELGTPSGFVKSGLISPPLQLASD